MEGIDADTIVAVVANIFCRIDVIVDHLVDYANHSPCFPFTGSIDDANLAVTMTILCALPEPALCDRIDFDFFPDAVNGRFEWTIRSHLEL